MFSAGVGVVFLNCWSRSRVFKTAGVGVRSRNNKKSSDSTTLSTPIYNVGECRFTDKFFHSLATLILWNLQFGFSGCSTREDLLIDASITNVGLILMKLRWFQLFSTSQNASQNTISNFYKKKHFFEKKNRIFRFPCCSTYEDLSIDALITNVQLILIKLRSFQLFVTTQVKILISSFFEFFFFKF